jgi:hypothetical protein
MIILNATQADFVRGLSPTSSVAALEPKPLKNLTYVLPEAVLTDSEHADVAAYLGALSTGTPASTNLYVAADRHDLIIRCIPQWECVGTRPLQTTGSCVCEISTSYTALANSYSAVTQVQMNDNGAWSWFMDERAVVGDGYVVAGSVRSTSGNVEVATMNISNSSVSVAVVHAAFEEDDHANPSFIKLSNNKYLAVWSGHATETKFYWALSTNVNDPRTWDAATAYTTPGVASGPGVGDGVTYSNLFLMPDGRIANFYRGVDKDWHYAYYTVATNTWANGGRLVTTSNVYGCYFKFAKDSSGRIHLASVPEHPREADNSLYHAIFDDENIYASDGTLLGPADGSVGVTDFTLVYQGGASHVAWITDVAIGSNGHPRIIFTTQIDGAGAPRGQAGQDLRFNYAKWNGSAWETGEIAYAGSCLYSNGIDGEEDYTGLAAFNLKDLSKVYISTNVDPDSGVELISNADSAQHHELFRGVSGDDGGSFTWTPLTAHSTTDNLRPIVPSWSTDSRNALVWMKGDYDNNDGPWTSAVVVALTTL